MLHIMYVQCVYIQMIACTFPSICHHYYIVCMLMLTFDRM